MRYLYSIILVSTITGAVVAGEASPVPALPKPDPAAPKCPDCEKPGAESLLSVVTPSKWLEPAARVKQFKLDCPMTDQAGKALVLKDLNDKPMAITFLYTRCSNPNKCPLAASTMAKLEKDVEAAGLTGKVRLLVVTYDPEYDTPTRLTRYGTEKGIVFNDTSRMLRPEPKSKDAMLKDLDVSVNYSDGRVNVHGLQLVLIDNKSRYVRNYHTLIWDNAKVLEDLKRLASE